MAENFFFLVPFEVYVCLDTVWFSDMESSKLFPFWVSQTLVLQLLKRMLSLNVNLFCVLLWSAVYPGAAFPKGIIALFENGFFPFENSVVSETQVEGLNLLTMLSCTLHPPWKARHSCLLKDDLHIGAHLTGKLLPFSQSPQWVSATMWLG